MAEPYRRDYLPIPDGEAFTRAPVRQALHRKLQENVQHLYGTRVGPVVVDIDLSERPATTPAFRTTPEYHVVVPEGVTTLIGTVIWSAAWRAPGHDVTDTIRISFQSERAGNGVAAGNELVTSAQVEDSMFVPAWPNEQRSVWDYLRLPSLYNSMGKYLGGDESATWIAWQPDMSVSREQRIKVRSQELGVTTIWGVYVYALVPEV